MAMGLDDLLQAISINVGTQNPNIPGTIIPAVAGKRIFVYGGFFHVFMSAQNYYSFLDTNPAGATITNLAQQCVFIPNVLDAFILPYQQYPWFTCAAGDGFAVSAQSTLTSVGGRVLYVQA